MAKRAPTRRKEPAKPARSSSRTEEQPPAGKKSSPPPIRNQHQFPVVGVGASAGGLEAFTAFLKHLPVDSGMAFVLIQHLDPKQPSQLADLLSKATTMPVREVTAKTPLKPNHIYVMGSGVCLSISDGQLRSELRSPGRNLPIDYFLQSLAQARGSKAIGVVLSGTASDGTLGLRAVKAEGGVTFAQTPSSARFDGMPRSAIAAGVVDFVLKPDEISKRLVKLTRHPSYIAPESEEDAEDAQKTESGLNRIFQLLRTVTGNDFTHYKPTTIRRRIHRRMVVGGSQTVDEYAAFLQKNPAEVRALADDLLICVTSFFREPESFEALAARVFPEMLKNRAPDDPIRIWVPGCATGEEAYSLAILLREFLEEAEADVPVQIFATDIGESALEKARAGAYSASALTEVSPARLKRFFVKTTSGWQIAKSIRENCIFARQNVTKDPPFRNLDLISCCNVLIYFAPVLQKKVLATFHYALKPRGVLMLGHSESVSTLSQSFLPLDRKLRLYTRQAWPNPQTVTLPPVESPAGAVPTYGVSEALDLQKTAERMLLAHYAPAGVIVDDALNVVHVRGDVGPYLQLAPGEPTYNLLKMAREGLVVGLRTAVLNARRKKTSMSQQAGVKYKGQLRNITLRVTPISNPSTSPLHFIVVFEEAALPAAQDSTSGADPEKSAAHAKTAPSPRATRENARLKRELAETRDYMQSIIEEQEASSEELKSANEEAQASNEELETAKEELQSANEELNTVNDELKSRNSALTELTSDLSNLLSCIDVPLIMVGRDLRIRRFTPSMVPILNLIESDMGRSISDLKPNIDVPDLPELLRGVVHGAVPVSREVRSPEGHWFTLRALPYLAPDHKIDGALLVLLNIDLIRQGRSFAEAIIETTRQPLVVLDPELRVRHVNRAFCETFRIRKEETAGRFIYDLGNGQWNIAELREVLEGVLHDKGGFTGFEIEHDFESIGHKVMVLDAREIVQETPFGGPTILLAIADFTERRKAQRALLENQTREQKALVEKEAQLARIERTMMVGEMATYMAHEINQPLAGIVTNAEAGLHWLHAEPPDIREAIDSLAFIVRDGNRASAVVRQIRSFTKNEIAEPVALDIRQLIREALDLVRLELEKNRVAVSFDLAGNLPRVRGDRVQLEQVILNLATNACDSMAAVTDRPRQILVSARSSSNEEVFVSMRDSGVGVDPQQSDHIFDAFFTTKRGGVGMGLSICRSIIQAHGGRIWATNNEGAGLTVQFTALTR